MRWKIIEPPSTQRVCCDGNCKTAYDLYRILCLCPRLDRIWSVSDLMQHPLSVRRYCAYGIDSRPTVSLSSNDAQLLMFMIPSDDAQSLMFTIPSDDAQSLMTAYPLSPRWVPDPSYPALFWLRWFVWRREHSRFQNGDEQQLFNIGGQHGAEAPW